MKKANLRTSILLVACIILSLVTFPINFATAAAPAAAKISYPTEGLTVPYKDLFIIGTSAKDADSVWFHMRDLTTNRRVISEYGSRVTRSPNKIDWNFWVSKNNLTAGHTYRVAIESCDSKGNASWTERVFTVETITPTSTKQKVNTSDGVKVRSAAGTSSNNIGGLANGTIFTISETKSANGYNWGKIQSIVSSTNGTWITNGYSYIGGWVPLDFCISVK